VPDEESHVAINSDQDIVLAAQREERWLPIRFLVCGCTLIATAISELARNIVT